MIILLERITVFLLGGILLFNMTQRRHLEDGEKKRFASLFTAVIILVFYLGILAIKGNKLPPSFIYPVFAVCFLILLILRRRIFIFRRKCRECDSKYSIKQILYEDKPDCGKCIHSQKGDNQTIPESVSGIDWENWSPKEKAVICYIIDRKKNKVLLIHKKRGLGHGKVNAPGGRIEPGETASEAAVRECQEEVGLTPSGLEKRMELYFQFTNGYSLYGEAFFTETWEGEPVETEEADPFWCDLDKIPWEEMWADDIHWLPQALKGRKQRGRYIFDDDEMLSQELIPLEKF